MPGLLLTNAAIYTTYEKRSQVEALLIEHGKITAAGNLNSVRNHSAVDVEEIDLAGATVLPGLIDAHIHLQHYALGLRKVDCETSTRQEMFVRLAQRIAETPAGEWILGHGWNQNVWPEGFGDPRDLNALSTSHPIYLTAKSLHAGWGNRIALAQANISSTSTDPLGGRIDRDLHGAPTGLLFESAMDLVASALPVQTPEMVAEAILEALPSLWGLGVTAVHDFDRQLCFQALQILYQNHDLKLRVLKSLPLESLRSALDIGLRTGFGDPMLRIGGLKAFADGALGPQTAAMLQPFAGSDANTGILLMDGEELFEIGRKAAEAGISLAVHAIGDRANHEILDGFSQLRKYELENHLPNLRHRIEHVQIIHPADASRLADLNIAASMQPLHVLSDMEMADRFWGDRSQTAYAWRTQLLFGARLAFGSDAPVDAPNPFLGLYAATTRRRPDGYPGADGWYPEQKIDLESALEAYTTQPAFLAGQEHIQGKLTPGYLADLIVLRQNPFYVPAENLALIRPQATMVNGEWVHEAG